MPAAAVIPAPIAYIKVVAVKKLVVGFLTCGDWPGHFGVCVAGSQQSSLLEMSGGLHWSLGRFNSFTLKKLECSKQAYRCEYISME